MPRVADRPRPPSLLAYGPCVDGPRSPLLGRRFATFEGIRYVSDAPYLLLDARAIGGPLLRLSPWDQGLRLQRWVGAGFEHEPRDFDPIDLSRDEWPDEAAAVRSFRARIPEEALSLVRGAPHLVLTQLRCIRASTRFAELVRDAPNLAGLLAFRVATDRMSDADVDRAASLRRRELLAFAMRGTARYSASHVKLVQRVRLPARDWQSLRVLRHALEKPEILDRLRHHATVDIEALDLLLRLPVLLERRWLDDLLALPSKDLFARATRTLALEEDARRLADLLDLDANARLALERAPTLAAVERLHDRWVDEQNDAAVLGHALLDAGGNHLAPPPDPGTDTIVPITTVQELFAEGRTMRHCVATYAHAAARGGTAIYRVLAPERATLRVSATSAGDLRIDELKLAFNQAPSKETRRVVRAWAAEVRARAKAEAAKQPEAAKVDDEPDDEA